MKRYLLFGWVFDGRGHGWNDFIGSWDTIEDALHRAGYWEYYQIVDSEMTNGGHRSANDIVAQWTFLEETSIKPNGE